MKMVQSDISRMYLFNGRWSYLPNIRSYFYGGTFHMAPFLMRLLLCAENDSSWFRWLASTTTSMFGITFDQESIRSRTTEIQPDTQRHKHWALLHLAMWVEYKAWNSNIKNMRGVTFGDLYSYLSGIIVASHHIIVVTRTINLLV